MKIQQTLFLILTIVFLTGITALESCKPDTGQDNQGGTVKGDTTVGSLDKPAIACLVISSDPIDPIKSLQYVFQVSFDEAFEGTVDSITVSSFQSNCASVSEPTIRSSSTFILNTSQECGGYNGVIDLDTDDGLNGGGSYSVNVMVYTTESSEDKTCICSYSYSNETMYVSDAGSTCLGCSECGSN